MKPEISLVREVREGFLKEVICDIKSETGRQGCKWRELQVQMPWVREHKGPDCRVQAAWAESTGVWGQRKGFHLILRTQRGCQGALYRAETLRVWKGTPGTPGSDLAA